MNETLCKKAFSKNYVNFFTFVENFIIEEIKFWNNVIFTVRSSPNQLVFFHVLQETHSFSKMVCFQKASTRGKR